MFEGNKGFRESIAGDFSIDWENEDLEKVTRTIIKKFNAEIHSQSTLEGLQDLLKSEDFDPEAIDSIVLNTFKVAYDIIGGGEEGGKTNIRIKEEADHSLPYMMAALLLDGNVLPQQYLQERIQREDIQQLLKKVQVYENKAYSDCFPKKMACDIVIRFKDGRELRIAKTDYEGFTSRPASWDFIIDKFNNLAAPVDEALRREIIAVVQDLENYSIRELMALLEKVKESCEVCA